MAEISAAGTHAYRHCLGQHAPDVSCANVSGRRETCSPGLHLAGGQATVYLHVPDDGPVCLSHGAVAIVAAAAIAARTSRIPKMAGADATRVAPR